MAELLVQVVPMADTPVEIAAHQSPANAVPVPPQYQPARVNDFRGAGFAPKGFREKAVKSRGSKRKLEEYQEQVDRDEAEMKDADKPAPVSFKKLQSIKCDISGVGKASGRQWKEPGQRAGALKSQNVSSSWEAKMRNKAETKIFRENRAEAIAVRKAKLKRARQQRSEAKAKKAEGQRKNTKVQQISNPATIKKMMKDKKQRKKLMTVDPANAAKGHA
ncbi:hypothetical protein WJX79_009400 [Trebouxia sp. C0005]